MTDLAPYDWNGSLLRTGDGAHQWRPIEAFRTTLSLTTEKGRGYVIWKDSYGRHYPMSISDLTDLLRKFTVSQGMTIGWWMVTNRRDRYGIRRLDVDVKPANRK